MARRHTATRARRGSSGARSPSGPIIRGGAGVARPAPCRGAVTASASAGTHRGKPPRHGGAAMRGARRSSGAPTGVLRHATGGVHVPRERARGRAGVAATAPSTAVTSRLTRVDRIRPAAATGASAPAARRGHGRRHRRSWRRAHCEPASAGSLERAWCGRRRGDDRRGEPPCSARSTVRDARGCELGATVSGLGEAGAAAIGAGAGARCGSRQPGRAAPVAGARHRRGASPPREPVAAAEAAAGAGTGGRRRGTGSASRWGRRRRAAGPARRPEPAQESGRSRQPASAGAGAAPAPEPGRSGRGVGAGAAAGAGRGAATTLGLGAWRRPRAEGASQGRRSPGPGRHDEHRAGRRRRSPRDRRSGRSSRRRRPRRPSRPCVTAIEPSWVSVTDQPSDGQDRERPSAPGHRAGERHRAGGGRSDRLARSAADVDPAVLPARVGMRGIERVTRAEPARSPATSRRRQGPRTTSAASEHEQESTHEAPPLIVNDCCQIGERVFGPPLAIGAVVNVVNTGYSLSQRSSDRGRCARRR